MTSPFRDRFGVMLRLELYTPEELEKIITRSAGILGVHSRYDGALEIARPLAPGRRELPTACSNACAILRR